MHSSSPNSSRVSGTKPQAVHVQSFDDNARDLIRSVESMMDGLSNSNYFRSSTGETWEPSVNVYELAQQIVVCVELAGVNPGELDVQVEGDVLHIRGQRSKPVIPDVDEAVCVHQMEIDSGRFHRKLRMPGSLNLAGSKATYRNGMVWIVLPKS